MKKLTLPFKLTVFVLMTAMLVTSLPLGTFATTSEAEAEENTPYNDNAYLSEYDERYPGEEDGREDKIDLSDVFVVAEDVSKRRESEKHYILSNGCMVAVSYMEPVHFRDEEGHWRDVDNTLTADSRDERIVSANKDFGVSFSKSTTDRDLVRITKNGYTLSWRLDVISKNGAVSRGSSGGKAEIEDRRTETEVSKKLNDNSAFDLPVTVGRVSYTGMFESFPEISANYTVYQNKIEEDVYFNSASEARSIVMTVNCQGLRALLNNDNSVSFVDNDGNPVYNIGVPYMADSYDEILTDIHVGIEDCEYGYKIVYTPDEKWLTSEERVYPILFDPAITSNEYNPGIVDTYVRETETSDYSSGQKMYIGVRSNKIYRSFIKITDLPAIDPMLPVISATLTLTHSTTTTTGKTAKISKCTGAWSASTITYASQPGSTQITTCAFDATTLKYVFDITDDITERYAGTTDYGYMIGYVDESNVNPDYNALYTSEYNTKASRPLLTVVYGYSLPSSLSNGEIYSFKNVGSGSFLTVHNGTDANRTNVYQYNTALNNLTNSQKFKLEQTTSGAYVLRAMCSSNGTNRVLDIVKTDGVVQSGGNVELYTNVDPIAQEWFIIGLGSNAFRIIPRTNMDLALAVYPSSANGTSSGTSSTSPGNAFVETNTGSNYQKWKIYKDGVLLSSDYEFSIDHVGATPDETEISGYRNDVISLSINRSDLIPDWEIVSGSEYGTLNQTHGNTVTLTLNQVGRIQVKATVGGSSATTYVNCRFEDGIYYLLNAGSHILASIDPVIKPGLTVHQYGSYTIPQTQTNLSDVTTSQLSKMWYINYLYHGIYEIRSMLNASHYFMRGDSNDRIEMTVANSTGDIARWRIYQHGGYYVFENKYYSTGSNTPNKVLSSPSGSTQDYAALELQEYTGSSSDSQQRWMLTRVTDIPSKLFLYRNDPGIYQGWFVDSNIKYYVAVNETRTLNQNGIAVASCNKIAPTDPVINWSGSSYYVTANSSTGDVTGNHVISGTSVIASSTGYTSAGYNLQVIPIANGTYFLKNVELLNYLQIDDGESPNYTTDDAILELWDFDGGDYQRWNITHVHDGYYRIESVMSGKAISVKSGEETSSEVSVVQQTYISSDRQKWKIIETVNGNYKFKARSSESYAAYDLCMAAADASNEAITNNRAVKQRSYSTSNNKEEWYIGLRKTINGYYDHAFNVRYDDANALVTSLSGKINRIYAGCFGITFDITAPTMINSTPDLCKSQRGHSINTVSINQRHIAMCPANPHESSPNCAYYTINSASHDVCENCTSKYQPYRNFIEDHPGGTSILSILFLGSKLYDDDGDMCNRSYYWYDHGIILQEIKSSSESYNNVMLSCLIHEIAHDLGAKDHYHEMFINDSGEEECTGGEMCKICHPSTGRDTWCIMCDGWRDNLETCNLNEVFCSGCYNDIIAELNNGY